MSYLLRLRRGKGIQWSSLGSIQTRSSQQKLKVFFFEGQQKLKDGDMAIFSMEDWSRELPLVDSST